MRANCPASRRLLLQAPDVPVVRLPVPVDGIEADLSNATLTVIGRGSELHFKDLAPWGEEGKSRGTEGLGGLKEIAITEIDVNLCREHYNQGPYYVSITSTMLCARAPGKDSCDGDSGGPMILTGARWEEDIQVGLVSFGQKCGKPKLPGVYHRISESTMWIMKTLPQLTSTNDPPIEGDEKSRKRKRGKKSSHNSASHIYG
jgi:secreted trypsin-like serine protease